MSSVKFHIKYPCGYDFYFEANSLILNFDSDSFDEIIEKACPFHGKNCKQIKIKK